VPTPLSRIRLKNDDVHVMISWRSVEKYNFNNERCASSNDDVDNDDNNSCFEGRVYSDYQYNKRI
jgi:hypothetical protein